MKEINEPVRLVKSYSISGWSLEELRKRWSLPEIYNYNDDSIIEFKKAMERIIKNSARLETSIDKQVVKDVRSFIEYHAENYDEGGGSAWHGLSNIKDDNTFALCAAQLISSVEYY